jgi:hypothetical protein
MASQYSKVTGNPSVRSGLAKAKLQGRVNRLPQMLANRQNQAILKRDTAFQNKQIALQGAQRKQRERESEVGMGMEAAKLGLNIGMSDMGKKTLGDITAGAGNAYRGVTNKFRSPTNQKSTTLPAKEGMFSNVNVGGALSSGLTGFGVGKLVGGKSKAKKSLFGAGAGGLMGMLSAPRGGGMMGGLIGGLTGGIGGYFS